MTRALLTCFHKYTPFGDEFYQPLFDYFIHQLSTKTEEYDKVYFLDSTWNFTDNDYEKMKKVKGGIIKVDPSLRYYDAYKEVLPQVKEELVLLLDNDTIIYHKGIIEEVFKKLKDHYMETFYGKQPWYDVVSIIDDIGTYKTDKLKNGNKFCPYLFATRKDLLMQYLDVEWGPNMPEHETFGKLTEKMLADGIKPYEWEEDKSNILLNSQEHGTTIDYDLNNEQMKSKDLGYYHIRAGSTPAYLLATKKYGDRKTYDDYLKNQPRNEYLRQIMWYWYMMENMQKPTPEILGGVVEMLVDIGIEAIDWGKYREEFQKYHGLV